MIHIQLENKFLPFPILETERLYLRRITLDDLDMILYLRSADEVMQYIERPRAKSKDDAMAFVEIVDKGLEENEAITWAVTLKGKDEMIGYIGLWRFQKENYRAETGYVLHPAYHRNGIMTEALNAVIRHAFEKLPLHSLEANINPDNLSSKALLEKCGFVQEAYFRENTYFEGRFLDSAIFSLLNRENAPPGSSGHSA